MPLNPPRQHQRRVQVQVVRHDDRPQQPHRRQHPVSRPRHARHHQPAEDGEDVWARDDEVGPEADGHEANESGEQELEPLDAEVADEEEGECVDEGEEHARPQRDVEQQLERHCTADDGLKVGPDDGDLRHGEEEDAHGSRVLEPTQLGQALARHVAQPHGQALQQQPSGCRPHEHPQEAVPRRDVPGTSQCTHLQVALNVPWVKVRHSNEPSRSHEGHQLPQDVPHAPPRHALLLHRVQPHARHTHRIRAYLVHRGHVRHCCC
mmetsp:Transcript_46075/g.114561  ORF Transcript_46075/g.114561 Transcript_46075/m.114561 type:complete len:264 (+) Transcript_46075:1650-2441(+)